MYGFAKFFPTVIFALMLCLLYSPVLADDNCRYNGNVRKCYDANGKETSHRKCDTPFDENGNCTNYSGGRDYTYDANGKRTSHRDCASFDPKTGNCTGYSDGTYYAYDDNGILISERRSNSFDEDGKYISYYWGRDYTYDDNGKKTSQKDCRPPDSNGNCTSYYLLKEFDESGKIKSEYKAGNYILDGCEGSVLKLTSGTGPELICLEAGGKLTCPGDFLAKNGRCIDKSLGCGDGYVEHDNRCEKESNMDEMKLRYTPSEANELTSHDNENTIEWIFE